MLKQILLHSLFPYLMFCLIQITSARERPNVLILLVDDMGWKDTGYMGSDFYETPNIDSLSQDGVVFTNAYSAAANCAPARASLLSGQYTTRHKIYNVGTKPRGNSKFRRQEHIPGVRDLDPVNITTWAQLAQNAGYRTATIGKWHLSDDPIPYGFDVNIGGTYAGMPPKGYYPPHPGAPGLEKAPADEFLTDRLAQETNNFIKESVNQPWLVYLPFFAVHTPIEAKKEYLQKYQKKAPGDLHQSPEYATMIQAVDEGIGSIIANLKKMGLYDNTLILFCSDNGGYGPITDMHPLKGYKGTYYEGGIRVPMVISWPNEIESGIVSDAVATGVDMYPTLCDAMDIALPTSQVLDGVSLLPLATDCRSSTTPERAVFWHFPVYLESYKNSNQEQRDPLFRTRPCSVIRKGKWKLLYYFEDQGLELYNLETDIGESNNLAPILQRKANELFVELKHWWKESGADLPLGLNPDFDEKAQELQL